MNTSGFALSGCSKALVIFGLILGTISTASAYTAEQQQMCAGDAFRLCNAEIPDVDRVTACMIRNKAQLSAGCKAVFGPAPVETTATPAKASKPLNLSPPKARRGA